MGPGEELCDGSPHRSKMTRINLKKGRMLTPSLGGVTAIFQNTDSVFLHGCPWQDINVPLYNVPTLMSRYENGKK